MQSMSMVAKRSLVDEINNNLRQINESCLLDVSLGQENFV